MRACLWIRLFFEGFTKPNTEKLIYCKPLCSAMVVTESIKISEATKKGLDTLKVHPRETYDDVISRLVEEKEKEGVELKNGS